ncbi:MAG: GNAT family N-acetyltransferase [Steroidobacteraceae bacterium]|jgi:RimJ/RimL family protein N-acetyltransferase|nr:GNAT family N-acetyltransferase [Steroidobacteraceae bacterium]
MSSAAALPQVPLTALSDGVVALRPWATGDAPALYEAARESIEAVGAWLTWLDALYAPRDAERWVTASQQHWLQGSEYRFAVRDAADDRLLGGAGLNHINRTHAFGNLGYWVRTGATGRGVATRATRLVARFGLATAGLGRIEILTATDNVASQRVATKAGATFEAVLRDRLLVRGRRIPARLYSLVEADLRGCLA